MTEDEELISREWGILLEKLSDNFGKSPDLKTILFLIGVQELGKGGQRFSKEEKEDLMHIAVCKILSYSGYYELEGKDKDGWPHWKSIKKLPFLNMLEQEHVMKTHILEYFKREVYGEQSFQ